MQKHPSNRVISSRSNTLEKTINTNDNMKVSKNKSQVHIKYTAIKLFSFKLNAC